MQINIFKGLVAQSHLVMCTSPEVELLGILCFVPKKFRAPYIFLS
jgi:hypothetical protein